MIRKLYSSPITVTTEITSFIDGLVKQSEEKITGAVMETLMRANVTVDKDELIKALEYDRGQYEKGFTDGYNAGIEEGNRQMLERLKTFVSPDEDDEDD